MADDISNLPTEVKAIASLLQIDQTSERDASHLFSAIESRLDQLIEERQVNVANSLAFPRQSSSDEPVTLTQDQWNKIELAQKMLYHDHATRREMLLKRLDCTIASFQWKSNEKKYVCSDIYKEEKYRGGLNIEPYVTIAHLMTVREQECDQLLNSVISSRKSSHNSNLRFNVPTRHAGNMDPDDSQSERPKNRGFRGRGHRGGGHRGGGDQRRGRGGFRGSKPRR